MAKIAAFLALLAASSLVAQPESAGQLLERAEKLHSGGDAAGALAPAREALNLCRSAKDPDCEARAHYTLGRAHTALAQHRDALAHYEQAADLRRNAGDDFQLALTLHNLAAAHWFLSEPGRAVEIYEEALRLRRGLKDQRGVALTLYGIGAAHWSTGQSQSALDSYREALALFRAQKNTFRVADCLNSLGLVYQAVGDSDEALEHYQQAIAAWRAIKNAAREAYTLNNLGLTRLERQEPQAALELFRRALPLVQTPPDARAIAYILHNLGEAYAKLGDHRAALDHYRQSLERKRALADRFGEAHSMHSAGVAQLAMNEPAGAARELEEALAIRREIGDHSGEAETLAALASVARARQDRVTARRLLEECLTLVESARYEIFAESLRTSFLSSRHRYYEQLIDLSMAFFESSGEMEHAERAFVTAERARARALLDALGASRTRMREQVDLGLLARERALEQQLRQASRGAAARQTVESLLEQWEEVEGRIRARSARYAELARPEIATVRRIQSELLDERSALLHYFLGERRSFLWVLTRDALHAYVLPSRARIEGEARRFYESLRSKTSGDRGAALAGSILGPAAARIAGKRLMIVADGMLQYVPVGALPDPSAPSRYLLERHEITFLPSASAALSRKDQPRARASKTLAVIADPVFDAGDSRLTKPEAAAPAPEFARLRFSRQEAERILAQVAPRERFAALDFEAGKELLTGGRVREHRALHLATHAVVDTRNPEWSRVLFSMVDAAGRPRDGALRLWEIYNLELDVDLVVLSACRSALGRQVRGEGLLGLARGFLYAGARSTVASLWDVEDRSTSELMSRFYQGYLGRGLRPAAALRRAQLELLRDARWSAPYHWAPFVEIGLASTKPEAEAGSVIKP
jgi:CHAT domain-containing protein/Tfp pilus assembly protein PilF